MVLHHLIDFCFDGGENKFIQINKFGARWIREVNNNRICFSKQQMKDAVSYLLSNCYFTVGLKIFCQIIAIPMGSDPAPFFSNLFLYYYESRWINELKKKDLIRDRKLFNIFLNAINDAGEFAKYFQDVYPEELELGKENSSNLEASFLDLDIKIKDGKFQVGLFDKRDGFPFTIVRMPYRSSNIRLHSSIGAEILRIARASNNPDCFSLSIKPLVIRMLKQGACKEKLANILCKCFNKHQNDFQYVSRTTQELLDLIF